MSGIYRNYPFLYVVFLILYCLLGYPFCKYLLKLMLEMTLMEQGCLIAFPVLLVLKVQPTDMCSLVFHRSKQPESEICTTPSQSRDENRGVSVEMELRQVTKTPSLTKVQTSSSLPSSQLRLDPWVPTFIFAKSNPSKIPAKLVQREFPTLISDNLCVLSVRILLNQFSKNPPTFNVSIYYLPTYLALCLSIATCPCICN